MLPTELFILKQEVMLVNSTHGCVVHIPYDECGLIGKWSCVKWIRTPEEEPGRFTQPRGYSCFLIHFCTINPVGSGCRQVHLVRFLWPLEQTHWWSLMAVDDQPPRTCHRHKTPSWVHCSNIHSFLNRFWGIKSYFFSVIFSCLWAWRHERSARIHETPLLFSNVNWQMYFQADSQTSRAWPHIYFLWWFTLKGSNSWVPLFCG